jgi:glutathione S-transferase
MNQPVFKPRAYVKEGCPFSFKYLVFMAEAGLLEEIEIVRLREAAPDFQAVKRNLSEHLGKSATFPTVEVEPTRYLSDSDRVIEHFARQHDLRPDDMPVLSFYKETIFPQLLEHHKEAKAKA